MDVKRGGWWLILALLVTSVAACVPAQSASPATSPVPGSQTFTPLTSRTRLPPKTVPVTPRPTLRPQITCTHCVVKPTPQLKTATFTPAPQPILVVNQEKLDVWDDPAYEGSYWHRQTQLITGEPVLALAESPDGLWTQIVAVDQPSKKDPRGYPGWVLTSGLAQMPRMAGEEVVVAVRSAILLAEPRLDATRLLRLYMDARLPVVSKNESWVEAALPDGRTGWLKRGEVRLLPGESQSVPVTQMIETARTLAGAPYLWGGATPDSPDCSGFTYRLFHVYGITLARDADDQAQMGLPVPFDEKKPGDLVFYSDFAGGPVTHVGFYVGNNLLMDANPWLGLSLHPLADMQKWYVFHSVRRVLPQ